LNAAALLVAILLVIVTRLRAKRRQRLREESDRWQEEQLSMLERRPYAELVQLPRRRPLSTPSHLNGLKFYTSRQTGDDGVIEISVREYRRLLVVFEASLGPSFEIDPKGKIVRHTYEHDPED
jgi:hypothetical protein